MKAGKLGEFAAEDVFTEWKRRTKAAKASVTIFSPYLDKTATLVLKNAAHLKPAQVTIVTTINADALLSSPWQLFELRNLVNAKYTVLDAVDIHA